MRWNNGSKQFNKMTMVSFHLKHVSDTDSQCTVSQSSEWKFHLRSLQSDGRFTLAEGSTSIYFIVIMTPDSFIQHVQSIKRERIREFMHRQSTSTISFSSSSFVYTKTDWPYTVLDRKHRTQEIEKGNKALFVICAVIFAYKT